MRLRTSAAVATTALSLAIAAHADTLTTYKVDNQTGSSLGTLTLDETSGKITDLTLSTASSGTFSGVPLTSAFNADLDEYISTFSGTGFGLQFDLFATSLVGYAPEDSDSCSTLSFFCDYLANVYTGSVPKGGPTPVAGPISTFEGNLVTTIGTGTSVTPEPSSIALLGTGLLSVAGMVRRRRPNASRI